MGFPHGLRKNKPNITKDPLIMFIIISSPIINIQIPFSSQRSISQLSLLYLCVVYIVQESLTDIGFFFFFSNYDHHETHRPRAKWGFWLRFMLCLAASTIIVFCSMKEDDDYRGSGKLEIAKLFMMTLFCTKRLSNYNTYD